jgi:rod shape-determining protein MreB
MALDLGSSSTRVFVRNHGLQVEMPSVVAVESSSRRGQLGDVVAIGEEAREMLGRTPEHLHAIRPIREGRVANYPLTEALVREVIDQARGNQAFGKPRVLLCVHEGIDEVGRRALQDCVRAAGAREVQLLPKSVGAAVGSELPIHEATASMVIDMGDGTTELCLMSLGGVVEIATVRIGGHTLDGAIAGWIRESHGLLIGERTTEALKIGVGSAVTQSKPKTMRVRGRDINSAIPREIEVSSSDIQAALQPALAGIVEGIRQMMNRLSPDLAGDLSSHGVVLSGGSALLAGMVSFLRNQTGTPVVLAQDPLRATVTGAGWLLEERGHLERVLL